MIALRARARRLFGRDKLSEHAVQASKVDYAVFHDLRRRASKVDEALAEPPRLPSGDVLNGKVWERLAEDLWAEFYGQDEPVLRAREQIDPRFRINRELADKHAHDESFRATRSMTRGHVAESALGLLGTLDSLRQSFGDELAEHAQRENEIAAREDKIESLDDVLAELRQQRQAADGDQVTDIDAQIRDLAKRKRQAVNDVKEVIAQQATYAGDLIDAAKRAIAAAAGDAQKAIKAVSLLPGKGAGTAQQVSPDQMIEFANRVGESAVLKQVLEMMGPLELSMGSTRRQLRKGGYEEMVDIETGDDLRLVLPSEKALLTHPVARLDFYRRFLEKSLMQYEMWSEQELKRGPLIIAADGSDSTRGAANVFCRGLTLACCAIGNREKRSTAALEFGSAGQLREFLFPKDRPLDIATALAFAEHFFAGGTDINQVLARAAELIRSEQPFYSADLVIVTDGGDVITEHTYLLRDELRAAGVKIHGICVGITATPYMVEVCDQVSSVFDYAGANATTDRLAIDLS